MRILVAWALLAMTASCVWQPPGPPQPVPLAPAVSPQPVPLAPAMPGPIATAPSPPAPAVYAPDPFAWLFPAFVRAPEPGRLTLSNFTFDGARVQAVVTPYPDCLERPGTAASDFELPLNATRIIAAMPGADICWRRAQPSGEPSAVATGAPGWTEWNRVFTASGSSIDSQL